jgi:hypothetical protein
MLFQHLLLLISLQVLIQQILLCKLTLLKLVYISPHIIVFCWWKLIIVVLLFIEHFLLIMASLGLEIIHRSFLFVHWEIFLAQILNSWFMIIRFYHFLNTTRKGSLLLWFLNFFTLFLQCFHSKLCTHLQFLFFFTAINNWINIFLTF